tara:strand:- start:11 stop:319 length:309 start_codon:yes stop_codon:yes gene_type:complete
MAYIEFSGAQEKINGVFHKDDDMPEQILKAVTTTHKQVDHPLQLALRTLSLLARTLKHSARTLKCSARTLKHSARTHKCSARTLKRSATYKAVVSQFLCNRF